MRLTFRLLAWWLLTAAPVVGQSSPDSLLPTDPAVTIGTLPNGLRYYIRFNHRPAQRAELRLVVNAGSILEDPDQRGLAHFVEHMAFNGTTHFAKQELVDYIESIGMRFGADLNAGTSFDETVYQLQVPTDSAHLVRKAFQILEDWAQGVSFDTSEIRRERGVVLEEWRLGRGAEQRMLDQELPVIFRGSRYAERLPIGTRECITQCPPEAIRRFYSTWYRPDLMAVVVVGDFDPKLIEALIRERFGAIPAARAPRPRELVTVSPHGSPEVFVASDPEATNTSVSVFLLRASGEHGTTTAWREDLLEQLAAGMLNERLYELTRKSNPPFLGAGAGRGELVRTAEVFSFGAAVPDSGVRRGLEAVLTELERAGRHGFTTAELDRAKREYLRGLEQAYAERDKTESYAFTGQYIEHFLSGQAIPGIAYDYARTQAVLPAVSLADLNAIAKGWLSGGAPVILVNTPQKNRAAVPSAEALLGLFAAVKRAEIAPYVETVSAEALVPGALAPAAVVTEKRDTTLGTREWSFANGIRVILKATDFKDDELLLSAWSPGGISLAADSLLTSARFASQLVSVSGIGAFTAIELQKKLAGKAVSVSPYLGSYEQGISGQASPKDVETLLQLTYLYFTAPRLDTTAVSAFLTNFRAALANRSANPQVAFQDTLTVTLTQHHPWSKPISSAIVDEVRPGAALGFYRRRFASAAGYTFFLIGSFDADSIRPLVQRYLGNLPGGGVADRAADPGIRPPAGVVERTVRKGIEPKSQTSIVLTGAARLSRQDRSVLSALGSVLEIRLREKLREELGGTYSVSVGASASRVPRDEYRVTVSFGSDPARADALVGAVFAEIDTLQANGPRPADLAKVKETLIRSRETNLRQNGWWLGQLLASVRDGDPPVPALEPLLAALTVESLRTAARTYLDRSHYVRVTLLPERQ
ncbi:MAG TPA: insulinase family protein [Gemmatimonadales bacterium]|jgi:zinc protease|nr:insulinase family protein [Gemmatimonadales bacterium]